MSDVENYILSSLANKRIRNFWRLLDKKADLIEQVYKSAAKISSDINDAAGYAFLYGVTSCIYKFVHYERQIENLFNGDIKKWTL